MTSEEKMIRLASIFADFGDEELRLLVKLIRIELKNRAGAESEVDNG